MRNVKATTAPMAKTGPNVFFLVGITAAAALLQAAPAQAGEACQELVRNKCGSCHFVTYICPRIAKGKGAMSWSRVVKDMVKEGMAATEQEQEQVVRCLAEPDANVKALCPVK
jgi:hypothetical protein